MQPSDPADEARDRERDFPVVLLRDGQVVEADAPPPRPASSRGTVAWALALSLIAGTCLWWADMAEEAVQPTPPAPQVLALQIEAPLEEAPPPMVKAAASAPEAKPEPAIEICGRGRFTREQLESDPELLNRTANDLLEDAIGPVTARMLESDSPRTRVAGWVMTAAYAREKASDQAPAQAKPSCSGGDCVAEPPQAAAARDAVMAIATSSDDPAVLRLALMACPHTDQKLGPPCMRALAERWVQIEPTNAAAWMQLAGIASQRKDERAVASAMRGVSQASVVDSRFGLLAHEAIRLVDSGASPLAGLGIAIAVIGIEAATVWPMQPVSKHCEAAALNDGARRTECEGIAMLFTEHSRQLLDFSLGITLGKRLGWSADRIERLEVQKTAMTEAGSKPWRDASGELVDPLDITSCRGIGHLRGWVRDLAEMGEIAALRKRIAASGVPEAQLAAAQREARQSGKASVGVPPEPARPTSR